MLGRDGIEVVSFGPSVHDISKPVGTTQLSCFHKDYSNDGKLFRAQGPVRLRSVGAGHAMIQQPRQQSRSRLRRAGLMPPCRCPSLVPRSPTRSAKRRGPPPHPGGRSSMHDVLPPQASRRCPEAIDPRLPQILPRTLLVLRPLPEQRDGAREVLRVVEQREGRNLDPPVHSVGPQDREDPVGRLALQHRDTQG
jgi:hypothetical protein